jgi:hypothetical protein
MTDPIIFDNVFVTTMPLLFPGKVLYFFFFNTGVKMPLFKLYGILSSSNIWLMILQISVANSAFANLKYSA